MIVNNMLPVAHVKCHPSLSLHLYLSAGCWFPGWNMMVDVMLLDLFYLSHADLESEALESKAPGLLLHS